MKDRDRVMAAIYARVSCEHRSGEQTVASQLEALKARVVRDGLGLEEELCFVDDGYSGGTPIRPALERLRDQAATGVIDRLYVHCPDRLARKYAYQVVLIDKFRRQGVEVVPLNRAIAETAEDDPLLKVQGMIAEYKRAKILERSRRGEPRRPPGLGQRPGRRPLRLSLHQQARGGRRARYEVIPEEAEVVRPIFEWIGRERCSIGEVCRRLTRQGVPTRGGIRAVWRQLEFPADWAAPRSLVHSQWESPQRLSACSISDSE